MLQDTRNKYTSSSTNPPDPRKKPPHITRGRGLLLRQTPHRLQGQQALPIPAPHHGLAGNRPQGVLRPSPSPGVGITSCPACSQSKWGSSGRSRWECREEKGNVRLPVSHSFRHQHWARGPQPRPAQCPPAVMGTPSPATRPLPGLPQPYTKPQASLCRPLAGAHGGARKLCGSGFCGRG